MGRGGGTSGDGQRSCVGERESRRVKSRCAKNMHRSVLV